MCGYEWAGYGEDSNVTTCVEDDVVEWVSGDEGVGEVDCSKV